MVKITKQLVSQNVINKKTYGKGNTCEFIAIHETANAGKGAGAQSHANLQSNMNTRQASWHYQVDDKGVIQSFDDSIRCWHGGTNGNNKSISIEICVNSDSNFTKAVNNTIALVQQLMKKHNIPLGKVKQHNYFTGKDCPKNLRSGAKGIIWSQFMDGVNKKKVMTTKPSPKPKAPVKASNKPNMATTSIVTYLQSINEPWSMANRMKLANKYGIKNYTGRSVQNLILLDKLRKGKPKNATSKKSTANLKVDGYFGKQTILALQRYFKTPQDGILSKPSLVIKKLQKVVGDVADGSMGKNTIRAMQKYFDTPQDGVLSKPSLVIKKLQQALNKGKL